MDISGSYTFNAPPDRVWDLLMDPGVHLVLHSGVRRFEPDGEDRYNVTLTVGLAAITGTYNGTVVSPTRSRTLVPPGGGRPGTARVREGQLSDRPSAPRRRRRSVDVSGTVQTGGPIARVGQRLIGGVAKMMLDRFFACLQSKLV